MGVLDTINRLRVKAMEAPEAKEAAAKGAETLGMLQKLSELQQRREERGERPAISSRTGKPIPTPEQAEASDHAIASSKVPARYRRPVIRTGPEADAYAGLRRAISTNTGAIVLLCGEPGAGKTHMACEAMLERCREGRTGQYVRAMDLLDELKATFNGGDTVGLLGKYARLGTLVVDEWHRRKPGEWGATQLWNVVDRRYAELRPTIIVSNGAAMQIAKTFDGAMWDRINEDGGVIECNWRSHREAV